MQVDEFHRWDVGPDEARRIQGELRDRVILHDTFDPARVRLVAGADNGYAERAAVTTAYAAVLVFSFPKLELVETRTAAAAVAFPYVPGLLSFREGPALLAAFRQLEHEPDVVLFDAQGYAHPRRFGAASHLGLILDMPAIGCAKTRLVGEWTDLGPERGARAPLVHRGETVGAVLRTREGRAPLYVSPGHRVGIDTAVRIALACCRDNRFMPEPTRQADRLVKELTRAARAER
jgi:deoxyribonuclease V